MTSLVELTRIPPLVRITLVAAAFALAACNPQGGDKSEATESATVAEPQGPTAATTDKRLSFIVKFKAPHPLSRAQDLEAAGRCEEAQRLAQATLTAQSEFAGLCFDRFTLGGAEIVLRSCADIPDADADSTQRDWLGRLTAMQGVEYAEPNKTFAAAGCE